MTKTMCASVGPKSAEASGLQKRKYHRHTKGTYIGLVAYVIQDSPNKMLTFKQIMEKLGIFVTGDRKGLENNIRVCLSSNKCFVKVPIDPECPNAKRNFWKVDESNITPKMLRRHFSDMTEMFPALPLKWEKHTENVEGAADPPSPVCSVKNETHQIKFSGPFSIESLLKRDNRAQRRISSLQDTQHKGLSTNIWSDQLPSRTETMDMRTYAEHQQTSMYCMPRSVEESVVGSWMKPVERMDVSPDHHRTLLYSRQLSYDQTVQSKLSSSAPYTYDFRYLRW